MIDAEYLTYDVLYVDQFKNKYFGIIVEEEGKYYVSFSDYDKKERRDFVALATDDAALFIHEFSQWTMEKCINGQILERWDEFL